MRLTAGASVERNRIGNPAVGANQAAISISFRSDLLAVQTRLHGMNSGTVFAGSTGKIKGTRPRAFAAPYTGGTNAGNNQ